MDLSSDLPNTSSESLILDGVKNKESEQLADDAVDYDETETLSSSDSSSRSQEKTTEPNAGSDIPLLPPEILFAILPRAIPPFTLLDTSLSAGGKSAWCQTLQLMRSIVLVCRSWYNVGIIFLYENICIRRYHQLESLLHTLTNPSAKHLRLLVKSLTINCYIPIDKTLLFRPSLEVIVRLCTSLSTFTYDGAYDAQTMFAHFPPHITHLRLEGSFGFHGLFSSCLSQLRKTLLSIHLTVLDRSTSKALQSRILTLSSLQSLSLSVRSIETLVIFRDFWRMPSLQRLIVSTGDSIDFHNPDKQMAVVHFLECYGRHVRQVGVADFQFNPEIFKRLLTCCPRLERLILHPSTFLGKHWVDTDDFFHPYLRWIDFTHNLLRADDYSSSQLRLSKKNFPALEGVRRFHNFPNDLHRWVDDCPQNTYAEMEEFVIEVFQHRLCYREGSFIWRFGDIWDDDNMMWRDSNSDSDSDYVPTSSDEWDGLSEESEYEWTNEDEDF